MWKELDPWKNTTCCDKLFYVTQKLSLYQIILVIKKMVWNVTHKHPEVCLFCA